jgi:hypothetical protein
MRALVLMLLGVLTATIGIWLIGLRELAWWSGMLGTSAVLGIVIIYVVAIDSRKRWPGTSANVRLGRVFSFYREPDESQGR